jgi:uncharacterized protein YebE (UPF0316 family)
MSGFCYEPLNSKGSCGNRLVLGVVGASRYQSDCAATLAEICSAAFISLAGAPPLRKDG